MYYITGTLFVAIKGILKYISVGVLDTSLLFPLSFAVWSMARYFIVINSASKITEKENELIQFIMEWEQECPESDEQKQLQRLHDLLVKSPTEITLGGYVTLNRKLILGVSFTYKNYLSIFKSGINDKIYFAIISYTQVKYCILISLCKQCLILSLIPLDLSCSYL